MPDITARTPGGKDAAKKKFDVPEFVDCWVGSPCPACGKPEAGCRVRVDGRRASCVTTPIGKTPRDLPWDVLVDPAHVPRPRPAPADDFGVRSAQAGNPRPRAAGRGIPAYEPFPLTALPPGLREFVEALSVLLDCDPAFVALPALTVAGAAVGNSLVARVNVTWTQPALVWTCAVADSGTGKSPSLRPISEIAFSLNKRFKAEYGDAVARHKVAHSAWKSGEDRDQVAEPPKPSRASFAVIDTTVERLIVTAGDSPRGIVSIQDEMAAWFASLSKYKAAGGSDVPTWLSMYDAGPTDYRRRTGEPKEVECDRTFVALCGGVQPGVLRSILADPANTASGLAARIDFAMPPKKCLRWVEGDLPEGVRERFGQVVADLARLPFDPQRGPSFVALDANARSVLKNLKNEFAARGDSLDGGPMAPVLAKADGRTVRYALIHHAVTGVAAGDDPGRSPIGAASMAAGESIARWFVREAERVYAMAAETAAESGDRAMVELIRRKGGSIAPRDLVRGNVRRYPTAEAAELALQALASAGLGRFEDVPPGPKGGRPGVRFVLVDAPANESGDADGISSAMPSASEAPAEPAPPRQRRRYGSNARAGVPG